MKNEKQLVLFFKKGTVYNPIQVAARLNDKFTDLGIPLSIPFDMNNPSQPLIIFNKGVMDLSMNYNDMVFNFSEESDNCFAEVVKIVEFLEEMDLDFVRFGYVSTFIRTKKDRVKYLEETFKNPDDFDSEFSVSKYKNVLIDSVRVNVWERNLTDKINKADFVTIIDINTPINEEYNITSSFVSSFVPECNKYIKEVL